MRANRPLLTIVAFCWLLGPLPLHAAEPPLPAKVDFNRDVRPILSDNCYACHGPDKNKRKADLRLDTKDGIFRHIEDRVTVVAGHPEHSELWRRVSSSDADEVMPKPSFGKSLTPRQIAILKLWIEQGADYKGHWAYLPLARPAVPAVDRSPFVRTPIDAFILDRLKREDLSPSPEADRATLIRRLSLDLTGLPPSSDEVKAFVADQTPGAYERVVDRLLQSPHFGEKMAMFWLDLVRYADTIGYHSDNPMPVWPYRDWVIRAFNSNLPFDRFTEMQLGGDLMPDATVDDEVASTYNRLLQTTEEGGAQAKEYIAKYDADRVRNVSTVWLGSTMGCCQCHDHKFDPFTQKDFYSLAAFFADIQEPAVGSRGPGMPLMGSEQKQAVAKLDSAVAGLRVRMEQPTPQIVAAQAAWEKSVAASVSAWTVIEPAQLAVEGQSKLTQSSGGIIIDSGQAGPRENYVVEADTSLPRIAGVRLEALADDALPAHGPGVAGNGNFVLTEFKVERATIGAPPVSLPLQNAVADFSQDGFPVANAIDGRTETGWAVMPSFGKNHTAVFELLQPLSTSGPTRLRFRLEFQSPFAQHQIGRFRLSLTDRDHPSADKLPPNIQSLALMPAAQRNAQQAQELATYYRSIAPELAPLRQQIADLEKQKQQFLDAIPKSLITVAGPPRTVRLLHRGNWMDDSGTEMSPNTPEVLNKLSVSGRRPNRLDLAQWLVSRDNPLTARVFVNRLWKVYFGVGLSKGLEDVGAQGEWPTHPELLDWLASEFQQASVDDHQPLSSWDVKHLVRLMVISGVYRQSSVASPALREKDPFNRLYARQARYRLDAEEVRDNALAISGLLTDQLGGPSVKPYQPAGYWDALNFPARTYEADHGPNQYRRGLYTWWQRSFLHPSLVAFDAPSHEEAVCERSRSNIPQQALVLLNDPTYVEASRALAAGMMRLQGDSAARVAWAFERALGRSPSAQEAQILLSLHDEQKRVYDADPASATKLLSDGDYKAGDLPPTDLAAWSQVARTILNLHETITRS